VRAATRLREETTMVELISSEGTTDLFHISAAALDSSLVPAFRARFDDLVSPGRTTLLDLSGVRFVDSAGLGAILSLARAASEAGGRLEIAAPTPGVRILLELVQLHHVIDVYNDPEEAFRARQPAAQIADRSGMH
jgi:anti-anti-sigma factor